ncbi:MAG: hypothetical protein ACFE8L_08785 [Candidatus Hodarchaeota archaeon]
MMMGKCKNPRKSCGMIRCIKDLVLLEDGTYMCFSCWNKYNKEKDEKT